MSDLGKNLVLQQRTANNLLQVSLIYQGFILLKHYILLQLSDVLIADERLISFFKKLLP